MENGHHPFEQMISFKGPKEKLKIKWTVLLLPQQGITTSKSHWADSRGKLKTEVSQAEPYRWPHRISTGWMCLVVLPLFFKVPSIQKESISWIPVAIMEIKASSKVLMLAGIHMQRFEGTVLQNRTIWRCHRGRQGKRETRGAAGGAGEGCWVQGKRRKCSVLAEKWGGEKRIPKQRQKTQILSFVTGISAIIQPSPPV